MRQWFTELENVFHYLASGNVRKSVNFFKGLDKILYLVHRLNQGDRVQGDISVRPWDCNL